MVLAVMSRCLSYSKIGTSITSPRGKSKPLDRRIPCWHGPNSYFLDPVNKKLCIYIDFKCSLLQRKSPLYNPEGYAGVKIKDN